MCIPISLFVCVWTLHYDITIDILQTLLLLGSASFKEQSPNVASVKNILESHASYLMSGKELSKLVAFVKGTQFDLVVREVYIFHWGCDAGY